MKDLIDTYNVRIVKKERVSPITSEYIKSSEEIFHIDAASKRNAYQPRF